MKSVAMPRASSLEPGVGDELGDVADLAVGAEDFGGVDEADGVAGEVGLELMDGGDGGVVEAGDAEEDFVVAGVLLAAVAGEGFSEAGLESVDGLEEADGRGEVGAGQGAADEGAGAPDGEEGEDESGEGEEGGDGGDGEGEHPGMSLTGINTRNPWIGRELGQSRSSSGRASG